MVFIFNDAAGTYAVAASTAGLADETAAGGTQCQAAGSAMMPMGLDPVSAANLAAAKAHTTAYASHCAIAGVNQHNYSAVMSESATAYTETDSAGAAGIASVGVNAAALNAAVGANRL